MEQIRGIARILRKIPGGNIIVDLSIRGIDYMERPNHFAQGFYWLLAGGGFIIYALRSILYHIPKSKSIPDSHVSIGPFIMTICYYTFYKACTEDAGVIQTKQQAKLVKQKYQFEHLLYEKENDCKTCKFEKPARSKHCKVCDVCVEKFDHHCVWINNCVGVKNYRWFLAFILMHTIICFYVPIINILIFMEVMNRNKKLGVRFQNSITGEIMAGTTYQHARYFFGTEEKLLGMVTIMCPIIAFVLFVFFLQHVKQMINNETTNEVYKKDYFRVSLMHEKRYLTENIRECEDAP